MKISSLITELQKLQALHGDLPVTFPDGEHGDHEVVSRAEKADDRFYASSGDLFWNNGPHIHLS